MPATFEPIATQTLTSSGAASVTFSSISGSYTDLRLVCFMRGDFSDSFIQFNSDTGSNYSLTGIYGDGTSVTSGRLTSQTKISEWTAGVGTGTNVPRLVIWDIFSYAGNTNKTVLMTKAFDRNGATNASVTNLVGLWRSTSAITSITIDLNYQDATQEGSTFTLYGIKAA